MLGVWFLNFLIAVNKYRRKYSLIKGNEIANVCLLIIMGGSM